MKNIYQNQFKIEVLQYISKGNKIAKASRKFNIHPSTIYAWTQIGIEGFLLREPRPSNLVPEQPLTSSLTRRMQQLEEENAVLRQAAKLYFMYN